jgi:DNA modification methylase
MAGVTPYYDEAGVTIYHGNCLEVLPTLGQVDHVITDPPYDEATHDGARRHEGGRSSSGGTIQSIAIDFDPLDVATTMPALLGICRRWLLAFCSLEMLGDYKRAGADAWVRAGVWDRLDGAPQFSGDRPAQGAEGIAIMHGPARKAWNGGGHRASWSYPVVKVGRAHPTQKPEPLMLELVSLFTDSGDLILDPFCGSGTTLVAAKRLGRKAIGIELNEQYCEIAAKRLAQGALPLEFSA